ncbi:HlyD family efflux transporter periplasmic adaptor subunit [Desulfosporosinus sp. PR]|uniref:efflux RND transporter periplasmic adaptor subunit n=1 Tax=Candidatus Desulfosporosinus nitrosoreducens TaxID=3401928 RepID=UPI0027E65A08|nr:HlyD family efflux transporter periplasmic adaptor subunit [Desulfosporosinus sp. PR]MDQ7093142.1 HlyD family efflux transporter periplasmic adaptor subunit [Desulfosporosinus sp. PR]
MKNKKTGKKKAIIWSIIGVLVVALGIAFYALPKKTNYTEVKATTGNLATNYTFSGSIEAKNRQTVYADKTMQIKDIKVQTGQQVSTDTVLMTTTMGEEIKPELAGEVSNIYADENAQIMPGAKLIDIVDYSDLQLKVQVDEYDLAAVSTGKNATVTIHALNKDVQGKITDVSKEGDYTNGVTTFTADISLPKDSSLRVGMSAEAKVLNQSVSNVVLLPMSAIQFDANNNPYVLLKDSNNVPKTVSLTLGINDGVQVEVKSGVKANDIILVPPLAKSTGLGAGTQMKQGSGEASQGSSGGDNGQ